MKPKALMSWSSGKDSAWSLHAVRVQDQVEVVGLVTTLNEGADRVAMHAVRHELLRQQAESIGLPLHVVGLPYPCSNEEYEHRLGGRLAGLRDELGVSHIVYGDLFLADIRAYREQQAAGLGLEPLFPLWKQPTARLARDMVEGGLEAWLTCVDTEQLAPEFVGRRFDGALLDALPADVDPCGENGEFHTFVTRAPIFSKPIGVRRGEVRVEPRFVYCDFLPA